MKLNQLLKMAELGKEETGFMIKHTDSRIFTFRDWDGGPEHQYDQNEMYLMQLSPTSTDAVLNHNQEYHRTLDVLPTSSFHSE